MNGKQPNEKGKARANDVVDSKPDDRGNSSSINAPSFGSKVLASASGLARDLIGSGNGALTSSLAESAATTGKAGPATNVSGVVKTSGALQNLGSSGTSSASAYHQTDSFRTSDVDTTAADAFEEFQQDSRIPFEQVGVQSHTNTDPWVAEFQLNSDHVTEYSQDDGLEVTQLLSDPYFVAMTDDVVPEPTQSTEDAADLFTEDFSAEEQKAAKVLKEDLPAPPIHQPIAADNPRNLVANFEALLAGNEFNMDPDSYATSSMVHFHSKEDQQEWYSQWSGVLNQYTDEVWGDMLPIVREEKIHAEAIKEGKENVDSKSVQRLNMILGHVEQYRHWRG